MTQDPLHEIFIQEFVKKLADPKLLWQSFSGAYRSVTNLGKLLKRQKRISSNSVSETLAAARGMRSSSCPAIITGELAPYVQMRNTFRDSFTGLATELSNTIAKNPLTSEESELRLLDKLQWNLYGPSIQSSLDSGVQVLQLTETEEVNSIPVVISDRLWANLRGSFAIADRPYSVELSGCLISTRSSDLERLIGIQEAAQLASGGHTVALVPDESLLTLASLDIDLSPKMSFSKQSTVYLAYLWVVYKDALTGDYWPIYEYGNIANTRSYDLLLKMLLDRISFYKRVAWKDTKGQRFSIGTAVNDDVFTQVVEHFSESPSVDRKHLLQFIRGKVIC